MIFAMYQNNIWSLSGVFSSPRRHTSYIHVHEIQMSGESSKKKRKVHVELTGELFMILFQMKHFIQCSWFLDAASSKRYLKKSSSQRTNRQCNAWKGKMLEAAWVSSLFFLHCSFSDFCSFKGYRQSRSFKLLSLGSKCLGRNFNIAFSNCWEAKVKQDNQALGRAGRWQSLQI